MIIQEVWESHNCTVYLHGVLNEQTSAELEEYLLHTDLFRFSGNWILECSNLEKMTASALRVLLIAYRRVMAAKGNGHMRGCNASVSSFLHSAGFDAILPLES